MQSFTADFTGADDGPPSTDAYKRAVYKQPPRSFAVQVLPPHKFGNAYSYGMLISPLKESSDRQSVISRGSGSSGSSYESQTTTTIPPSIDTSTTAPLTTDYEVWRRWEDCLYFQDVLEVEYGRMSREKRARLHAGKGVKKNGMYEHQDPVRRLHRAASFESLPPGPDPNLIAKDVHELLPRLTKKGTLFKASRETIEQRGLEFKALIEALLREGDDVPALIRELRQLRVVRDFFGFWRRDQDRMEKLLGVKPEGDKFSLRTRSESVGSRASSIFSSSGGMGIYFSPSTLSLQAPTPNISEPLSTNKSPRRPAFMQGGKGAINLVPPSSNEAGPSNVTPRRRAQTLQSIASTSSGTAADGSEAELQDPPASAPACITFAEAMYNGYNSDTASAASSKMPLSPQAFPTTPAMYHMSSPSTSPRSLRTKQSPRGQMEIRFSDIILADDDDVQKTNGDEDTDGPIIMNLEESEVFDEDNTMFHPRLEAGYFVSRSTESRLGGLHRLQDLTIKEEDERELDDEHEDIQYGYAISDSQASVSSTGRESTESVRYFGQPGSSDESYDERTINDEQRSKSPTWSNYSVPISSARVAAARREALRSLMGGDPSIPTSGQNMPPSEAPSARSSVLTMTSGSGSGSGSSSRSTNSGNAHSSDTQSSVDGRPYSFQSAIASCEDIDRTLSSSPIILHSPLLDDDDVDSGYSTDRRQSTSTAGFQSRDSISSVRTFMTEPSVDAIIPPPRPSRAQRPPPSADTPTGSRQDLTASRPANLQSPGRMTQVSSTSESQDQEELVEMQDSYFFGLPPTTPNGSSQEVIGSPLGREYVHGSPPQPDGHQKAYPSKPTGQSNLAWSQQRPMSPGSGTAHNLIRPMSPSHSASQSTRSISPSPSVSTYAPSIMASLSEESGVNAVSIKAIYGEHIIAFRIDRSSSLMDVREKLKHKLVNQLGVPLSEKFSLAHKPPGPGRVQQLRRAAGRARSSSVSSVGATDPGSLRILFSQRDWMDTIGSCPPGAKVTLHVLNG